MIASLTDAQLAAVLINMTLIWAITGVACAGLCACMFPPVPRLVYRLVICLGPLALAAILIWGGRELVRGLRTRSLPKENQKQ